MDPGLVIALALALAFAATNGIHDASNAIATLVATRVATPLQAILLASFFNLLGPLLVGAAVADTIAGIVKVSPGQAVAVIGAGLAAAVVWNLLTWRRGLPSSSSHALVGGLVGAALADGGLGAVQWGGLEGLHPVGVFGALIALAISPVLGFLAALALIRIVARVGRRATRRWNAAAANGQWFTSAALAFSHGANDAQKAVGVIAALLLAEGRIDSLQTPGWVVPACAIALTAGTAVGGWRIIRTIGRGIYRIGRTEGMVSQSASAAVILGASFGGAPTSTSQVVASSVVGIGGGRRRWHHVSWGTVREILLAWVITLPATGLLAVAIYGVTQWLG
jgi:PiT family inorganic phosphate transporter